MTVVAEGMPRVLVHLVFLTMVIIAQLNGSCSSLRITLFLEKYILYLS